MKKQIQFFTITPPTTETNTDGTLTSYELNTFLNQGNIEPLALSAEFLEESQKILVCVAFNPERSIASPLIDLIKGNDGYQVRFETLGEYRERAHTHYIRLTMENVLNSTDHSYISNGMYVENHIAKAIFLESKKKLKLKVVIPEKAELV